MATRTDALWVLDTSVVAAWFFEEQIQHAGAVRVMRDVRRNPELYVVPQLFFAELVHATTRAWGRDVTRVRFALELMIRFGLRTVSLADSALGRMTHWSCRGLGGYDATFVALAEDLGGRWLTADARAARIADEHAVTLLGWTRIQNRS